MEQNQITEIIGGVITAAAKANGWSLAELTRRVGKGENTLYRWKTGATSAYNLRSLIKIFKMAGWSMDEAFGLHASGKVQASANETEIADLRRELSELKQEVQLLKPLADLLNSVASAAAVMSNASQARQEDQILADRARASFEDSSLSKATSRARKLGSQLVSEGNQQVLLDEDKEAARGA